MIVIVLYILDYFQWQLIKWLIMILILILILQSIWWRALISNCTFFCILFSSRNRLRIKIVLLILFRCWIRWIFSFLLIFILLLLECRLKINRRNNEIFMCLFIGLSNTQSLIMINIYFFIQWVTHSTDVIHVFVFLCFIIFQLLWKYV